jgi:hypothetical protein
MKKRRWLRILIPCVIAAVIIVLITVPFSGNAVRDEKEDSIRSITETVQEMALQCYVIEGAYPQSLEYLREHYKLAYNEERFIVEYDAFAENMMPYITVLERGVDEL